MPSRPTRALLMSEGGSCQHPSGDTMCKGGSSPHPLPASELPASASAVLVISSPLSLPAPVMSPRSHREGLGGDDNLHLLVIGSSWSLWQAFERGRPCCAHLRSQADGCSHPCGESPLQFRLCELERLQCCPRLWQHDRPPYTEDERCSRYCPNRTCVSVRSALLRSSQGCHSSIVLPPFSLPRSCHILRVIHCTGKL